jgi:hypothetical protein
MNAKLTIVTTFFLLGTPFQISAQDPSEVPPMGFFVTSTGSGDGANLGGLDGADKHCQALAEAAGTEGRTWRAYLSTQATSETAAINARDRIGVGPWHNFAGDVIASGLDDLHYNNANIHYLMATDENGHTVNSGGMKNSPNKHDILTGSNLDGTAFSAEEDRTCSNWTTSGEGTGWVGHHDRFRRTTPGSSWNSVHKTRGCDHKALEASGGAGLFYCFATD